MQLHHIFFKSTFEYQILRNLQSSLFRSRELPRALADGVLFLFICAISRARETIDVVAVGRGASWRKSANLAIDAAARA